MVGDKKCTSVDLRSAKGLLASNMCQTKLLTFNLLRLKIQLIGWAILNLHILITLCKERHPLSMGGRGAKRTFTLKLSETMANRAEAILYCNEELNGRLFEIQTLGDLHRMSTFLEKQRGAPLVHVGRIRSQSARRNLAYIPSESRGGSETCWAAKIIPSHKIPVVIKVRCDATLRFICEIPKRTGKRAISYSYLYVKDNWQSKIRQLIFGSDGCWTKPNHLSSLESRVVGGSLAKYGSQPWQVEIAMMKHGLYHHHCSGVILSSRFIITAAHCFKREVPLNSFRVTTGDYVIGAKDEHEDNYEIEKLAIHPKHEANGFGNDIAIVKVKSPKNEGISFGSHVRPACIPTSDTPHIPGTDCVVSGWGTYATEANSRINSSSVLQSADVKLLSTKACREVYNNYTSVGEGMICAGYWDGRIDSCRGDSGGPLVCNVDNNLIVLGLVSWGDGCAQPNRPGVYVHVQHYLDWIHRTFEDLS